MEHVYCDNDFFFLFNHLIIVSLGTKSRMQPKAMASKNLCGVPKAAPNQKPKRLQKKRHEVANKDG
jgi:hypothetical protein